MFIFLFLDDLLVSDKAEVSLHPERPSNDDLPSKFFSMAFSDAEGDKGIGPPPVFGLLISDSFPFFKNKWFVVHSSLL